MNGRTFSPNPRKREKSQHGNRDLLLSCRALDCEESTTEALFAAKSGCFFSSPNSVSKSRVIDIPGTLYVSHLAVFLSDFYGFFIFIFLQ